MHVQSYVKHLLTHYLQWPWRWA